jgi:sugar/nucleoside kinase (ribokinase family)
MKKIVGIGNALVDIMTPIPDDSYLNQFGLPKGSMTLVDAETSDRIKDVIKPLNSTLASGGSAGNTLYGLGILGIESSFIGKVGRDEFGNFYEKDMIDAGLRPFLLRSGNHQTGTAVALVSPDSERTFATHLGAATELDKSELNADYFAGNDILYIEGYLIYNFPLVEQACRLAKENNLVVAIDLASFNVVNENIDHFKEIINKYADIVFANEEEAKAYSGLSPRESLDMLSENCSIAVVKLGAEGSLIKRGEEVIKVDALKAKPVDTTGAGDLYASGFLYGYSQDMPLDQCGLFGSILAGKVIEVIGARMPAHKWDEVKELIKSVENE